MLIVDAQIHLWEKGTLRPTIVRSPTRQSRQSPEWTRPALTGR